MCCNANTNENENEPEKDKLTIFKVAVFIIENFLDDEEGVRSFFGESSKRWHLGHVHCSKCSSSALLHEDEEAKSVKFLAMCPRS